MPTGFSDEELLARLDSAPPAWVVTRTRRLAHDLRLRVAELRAAGGREVADTPPIRSLDDLLEDLGRLVLARELDAGSGARAGAKGRILLSRTAEQLLWERVIASSPGDLPRELLDVPSLAATAVEAWGRVCLWGEPPWAGPLVEDVEAFRDWLPAFRAHLDSASLVTSAELSAIVAEAIAAGALEDVRPGVVVVLGFERPDPALTRILAALRARGSVVQEPPAGSIDSAATPQVLRVASRAAEARLVASRIRARLVERPQLRVAVLAPDLASSAALLERVFEEELDPAGVVAVGVPSARRFDFAAAPSLADYPLVASALDLLGLDAEPLAFEAVSRILLAPYPRSAGEDGEHERVRRGALEARLRRARSARPRLADGSGSVAQEAARTGLDDLARRFGRLARHVAAGRGARRSPGGWRREWIERLDIAGWPGALAGAAEGLVFRRWRDAMDEFASLEVVEPSMGEAQALARLRSICGSMPVQPPSRGLSVKVLSLLDAAGLEFDLVFVIGMTATAFPAAPKPNPLLPVAWQRAQPGMPRASVEGERELAGVVWSRLLASAAEVIVTWPAVGDSDEENTPSALIAGLPFVEAAAAEGEPWWLAAARASAAREPRPPEGLGPPLVRRGGSQVLAQQSSCGFRAFAATRLGVERLAEVQPQPDAARRGNLVHAALGFAYRAIPSSVDLAGLGDENIADVARDAARAAVEADRAFFEDASDLEDAVRRWLTDLVMSWMLHERDARTDAWTVESMEETFELAIPPGRDDALTIRFRPDRIDRTGPGGEAIALLDFKTSGSPKKRGLWAGDRPDEPQLPLYLALLAQDGRRVDALAFANLSARDKCSLEGLAATEIAPDCGPPGGRQKSFPPSWPEAVASMRAAVEALASSYLAGEARVDPKSARVCKYCGTHALCRVIEGGAAADDEAPEDEE